MVHLRVISFSILSSPFSTILSPSAPSPCCPCHPSPRDHRRSLDGTNYYPSQVHFFLFPRSLALCALPRFTPKRPSCDKKLRELGSATLRFAQLPATRVNLSARGARKLQQPARCDLRRNHVIRSQNKRSLDSNDK